MSDIPAHYRERLDLREQIARIDRMREESLKFTAEQHKLTAEAAKLKREPWIALLGAAAALFAAGAAFTKLIGH
jgi:hypothetical protein